MSSAVTCGLPILRPFALAFAIPLRTLSRMIRSSSSANTPLICIKAFVIGSICPLVQSTQMLPTMERGRHLSLTVSMISHSCFVLLARRETSSVMMVSPACAVSNRVDQYPKMMNIRFIHSYAKKASSAIEIAFNELNLPLPNFEKSKKLDFKPFQAT